MSGKSIFRAAVTNRMLIIGMLLGGVSWVLYSAVDAFLHHEGDFFTQLFAPSLADILLRLFISLIFVVFGAYAWFLIDRQRRFGESMRSSEEHVKNILDSIHTGIVVIDPKTHEIVDVNSFAVEMIGARKGDIIGHICHDFICPAEKGKCPITDLGEKIGNSERLLINARRERVPILKSVVPVIYRGGEHLIESFIDISGNKHAEEFIKNILESVDEGFIVINRDYHITSANKAYCDKLNLPLRDIIGKPCYAVSHRLSRPCYEAGADCAVRHTFETGEPHAALHVHYDKDGMPIYIETKSFPLKDPSGEVVSAIEILNDITEKKKLEDQLRHAQKMEAVGTLAGGVAHDFNNILTAIIGYASLLQMRMSENDPLRSQVDQILASTERAAGLTQSLLAFSRKQVMNPRLVDMNGVVKRIEKFLSRLIGEDIELVIRLSGENATVRADSGQIEQVLTNLVTNARDAMLQGGLLTIETGIAELDAYFLKVHGYGRPGKYVLVSVSDTGVGMDKRTRERIFEPFYTTKEVGRGTGLGLAIVYGIVKQHGGYINVYSEQGRGTTFKLYLPLIAAMAEAPKHSYASVPMGGAATVLVAEDDNDVRRLTKAVLEGFGYTVIEAVDGDDAIMKFVDNKERIQLLILDVIMPRKNGKEAYEAIKKVKPDIKALFTSGYAAEIIHNKGMLDEDINFISKPIAPRDLLKKVKDILDSDAKEHIHVGA